MLSKELTSDDWTKIARGEWKPKPYDLRMAGFDALKLLKRAESAEAELLSLREQLAELKALQPMAEVVSKFGDPEAFGERELNILADIQKMPYGTQLFTAAKPAEMPRHIFSMLVNELRDVPAIGCKRQLIIGALNRHGVIAEPVQCDPPATE
ncbi:TPA: polyphosphate kinase [Yersinia enterocolitica]|uniref:polyphosphate kinase n=1 Tax=Yersinia enterocolitica TaxID=630 RepID=UPI003708FEAB